MDDHQLLVQLLTDVRDTNRELVDSNRALAEELGKMREGFDRQHREMKTAQIFLGLFIPFALVVLALMKFIP